MEDVFFHALNAEGPLEEASAPVGGCGVPAVSLSLAASLAVPAAARLAWAVVRSILVAAVEDPDGIK